MLKIFRSKKGKSSEKKPRNRGVFLFINNWPLMIGAWLFVGLAPLVPEPLVFLKWGQVFAGGLGMDSWQDWGLLVLHSLPWLLLGRLILRSILKALRWVARQFKAEEYRKAREAQLQERKQEV